MRAKGFKTTLRFHDLPKTYTPSIVIHASQESKQVWAHLNYENMSGESSIPLKVNGRIWDSLMGLSHWNLQEVEISKGSRDGPEAQTIIKFRAESIDPEELCRVIEALERKH